VNQLHIQVLASSSSGNATLINTYRHAYIFDIGMGPRYIANALKKRNYLLTDISAVFITHLHSDHVHKNMIKKIIQHNIPVYLPATVYPFFIKLFLPPEAKKNNIIKLESDTFYQVDNIKINSFAVKHDSPGGCYGYIIQADNRKVVLATDIGYTDDTLPKKFSNADVIILESNHDLQMLNSSSRPAWLKKRITASGHLSNNEASLFLEKVLSNTSRAPAAVFHTHISSECNTHFLVKKNFENTIAKFNFQELKYFLTYKKKPSEIFSLRLNNQL